MGDYLYKIATTNGLPLFMTFIVIGYFYLIGLTIAPKDSLFRRILNITILFCLLMSFGIAIADTQSTDLTEATVNGKVGKVDAFKVDLSVKEPVVIVDDNKEVTVVIPSRNYFDSYDK